MQRRYWIILLSLVVLSATAAFGAPARGDDVTAVSGPSPLECPVNDRTYAWDDHPDVEEEMSVAVNPRDRRNIVIAWNQDGGLGIVVAYTRDGGTSWSRVVVGGLTACTGGQYDRVVHPRLSFGPDGVVFLSANPLDSFFPDPRHVVTQIAVTRSHDGGQTWQRPTIINTPPALTLNDIGTMTAELDVAGAASLVWSNPEAFAEPTYVSRTTDHGETWTTTQARAFSPGNIAGKSIAAHPGGALLVFIRDDYMENFFGVPTRTRPISVVRSTDKGASWSQSQPVVDDSDAFFWPLATVSPDGVTSLLWGVAEGEDRFALWLRTSRDAAVSWAAPRKLFSISNATAPAIVSGSGGLLAISYYDRAVDRQGQPTRELWLAHSHDGGASWAHSRVAGPFEETTYEHWLVEGLPLGYETSIALTSCRVHTAFIASGELARYGPSDAVTASADLGGGTACSHR